MTKHKSMKVDLDIHTVENVTAKYLQEMYVEVQGDIAEFIRDRVEGNSATLTEWEEYDKLHGNSEALRKCLIAVLSDDDYTKFMETVYNKFYPIKKG